MGPGGSGRIYKKRRKGVDRVDGGRWKAEG
jgi:hypothetical protein